MRIEGSRFTTLTIQDTAATPAAMDIRPGLRVMTMEKIGAEIDVSGANEDGNETLLGKTATRVTLEYALDSDIHTKAFDDFTSANGRKAREMKAQVGPSGDEVHLDSSFKVFGSTTGRAEDGSMTAIYTLLPATGAVPKWEEGTLS